MNHNQLLGIGLGGLLPAVALGVFGVLIKASGQAGLGASGLLLAMAVATAVRGMVLRVFPTAQPVTTPGLLYAAAAGLLWAVCQALILLAVTRWQTPVSKLVPLYNMNTLVAVLLGLVWFAEYQSVSLPKLVIGAALWWRRRERSADQANVPDS